MSCKLRIEYPGAVFHFMNRGDRREDIFRDYEGRHQFLTTMGEGGTIFNLLNGTSGMQHEALEVWC
ncbi:MAG: hypothetical protein NT154_40230 [Verrucomicrobia bacterium]|nr:hypothetical protein [Verrucomicrobiota bacterium]